MAFFEQSHGMQINGGSFYNVAGSMNIEQRLPFATMGNQQYLPHLPDPASAESSRGHGSGGIPHPSSHGVQRSLLAAGSTRYEPYSASRRRQITSGPHQPPISQSESDATSHNSSLESDAVADREHWAVRSPVREPGQQQPTTTIYGGTFVSSNVRRESERGIDLLHGAVALAALHDSGESFPQPRCHPETRTEIMQELHEWSLETDPSSTILWLHGPAGAGKSAIMQTFSSELQSAGRLGGSFFFKRDHATRGNAKTFFATIAYQLALSVPWLKGPISGIVEEDPSILARSMQTQLQKLICDPSRLCPNDQNQKSAIIVIDGLDECEGQHVQEEILRAIRNSTSQNRFPFRFIVASRPEAHICEVFESSLYRDGYQSFDVEQSFEDVRKYLRDEFSRIHWEHRTMATIPEPWPSPDILEILVSKSSGYFIYASTIIKFIDDKNYRPTERLAVVQDAQESDSAFDALDQLYMKILSSVPRQTQLLPLLCAIANFDFRPDTLDRLLGLGSGNARLLLRGLHSVLRIPEDGALDDRIDSHHASFFDFLIHPRRSGAFNVGGIRDRMHLAQSLLGLFAGEFRTDYEFTGDSESRSPLSVISLITSLPPSAELLSSIRLITPDYIFQLYTEAQELIPWLKKIPRVPADLVRLWEDYDYMTFFSDEIYTVKSDPPPKTISLLPLLENPGMLRFLQVMFLVYDPFAQGALLQIRLLMGLTWDDLKTTICALRPIIGREENKIQELVNHLLDGLCFGEAYPWPRLSRDLARQLLPKLNANKQSLEDFPFWLEYLIRSSPACPELLNDLLPVLALQLRGDGYIPNYYMYNVSKWLELFPDCQLELFAFCTESLRERRSAPDTRNPSQSFSAEDWRWERNWKRYMNPRLRI
ncbi:hypothetical protein C8R45DRAFT_475606 [Mycena sanguinolenta]|nr:hypothetical protein C8R45DRAFT_475606 [Mycena sanguinolenta]